MRTTPSFFSNTPFFLFPPFLMFSSRHKALLAALGRCSAASSLLSRRLKYFLYRVRVGYVWSFRNSEGRWRRQKLTLSRFLYDCAHLLLPVTSCCAHFFMRRITTVRTEMIMFYTTKKVGLFSATSRMCLHVPTPCFLALLPCHVPAFF